MTDQKGAFIDAYAELAMDVSRATGIAPEVVMAQVAHESTWGRSGLANKANNMFSMKAGKSWQGPTVQMGTREVRNGKSVREAANWRSYPDKESSFLDYAGMMSQGRFANVGKQITPKEQIHEIAYNTPYATEHKSVYERGLANAAASIAAHPSFQETVRSYTDKVAQEQVGVPETYEPDFRGVAFNESPLDDNSLQSISVPAGSVEMLGGLPDLSASTWGSLGLPDTYAPNDYTDLTGGGWYDEASFFSEPTYPDITEGLYGAPPDYGDFANKSFAPASAGFSLGQDQFNDVFSAGFPADYGDVANKSFNQPAQEQSYDFSGITGGILSDNYGDFANKTFDGPIAPVDGVPASMSIPGSSARLDASGWGAPPAEAPQQPTGFHAGFDGWGPTPDDRMPSLDQRLSERKAQDRIDTFENGHLPGISYGNNEKIATGVMNELSPSTQAMAMGDFEDKIGTTRSTFDLPTATATPAPSVPSVPDYNTFEMGDVSMPSTVASIPRSAPAPQASTFTPSYSPPAQQQVRAPQQRSFAPSFAAPAYSDPYPDLRGPTLSPEQYAGQVASTYGIGKPHGGFMDAMVNPQAAAAYNAPGFSLSDLFGGFGGMFDGGLFGGSAGYFGGGNNTANSSRGDGSYADQSGYSDNSPQGIL